MKRALPLLAAALLLAAPVAAQAQSPRPEITSLKGLIARYSSEGCKECHPKVYAQWAGSQHARPLMGMDDQVFLTRYLKEGPMALAKGAKATRDNLMCVKCHLPQVLEAPGGVSEAVLDELAQAILKNDKATLRQLNIGCPVCHQDKAVVHGRAERGVIYGSKDIPGHPGSPVKKSPLLKNSLHCGQCHGLGPVLDFHNPQQCATLYGSHLHAYIPSGGTQTCQDCHLPRGDHSMPPNFNDRAQTSALYRAALPLEVSVQGYTFQPKEEDKRPLLVVRTKVSNKAGHRIPDGWPSKTKVVLDVTAETPEGKTLFKTSRFYMPQAGDALGSEMVLGPDRKLGFLRDTSIQPFAPREETLEIPLPAGVRQVVVKTALSYQPRPGNVYPLQEQVHPVRLDR